MYRYNNFIGSLKYLLGRKSDGRDGTRTKIKRKKNKRYAYLPTRSFGMKKIKITHRN